MVYGTDDPVSLDFPFHISDKVFTDQQKELHQCVQNIHSHEYLQILMVLKGKISHQVNGELHTLNAGDVVAIPSFQKHQDYYEWNAEVVTISFLPHFIDSFFVTPHLLGRSHNLSEVYFKPFIYSDRLNLTAPISMVASSLDELKGLISRMTLLFPANTDVKRAKIQILLKELLLSITECLPESPSREYSGQGSASIYTQKVKNVIAHLEKEYAQEIIIEDVIKSCHISGTYFRKIFQEITGKSCLQYINELRIFHAINLIRQTDFALKRIATDVGFSEFPSFHRVFKRIKGIGPQAFRDSLLKS